MVTPLKSNTDASLFAWLRRHSTWVDRERTGQHVIGMMNGSWKRAEQRRGTRKHRGAARNIRRMPRLCNLPS